MDAQITGEAFLYKRIDDVEYVAPVKAWTEFFRDVPEHEVFTFESLIEEWVAHKCTQIDRGILSFTIPPLPRNSPVGHFGTSYTTLPITTKSKK